MLYLLVPKDGDYGVFSDMEKFMIGHQVGNFLVLNLNESVKTFPVERHGQELHLQRS